MPMPENWRDLLDTLYLQYGDFYTHRLGEDGALWSNWKTYSELGPEDQPNQRQILGNEIVFDLDYDRDDRHTNIRNNLSLSQYIRRQLEQNEITYSEWRSGGKGVHIHVFMQPTDADILIAESRLYNFKNWFIKQIAGPLIDLGVIDLGTTGERQLIQLEHTDHRKRTGKKLKRRGTHLKENTFLPWISEYLNQPIPIEDNTYTEDSYSNGSWSESDNELIQYCLEHGATDCRHRLLFFAANRIIRTDDAGTTVRIMRNLNKQFADAGNETYVSDRELEQFVSRARAAKRNDVSPPSYEWMHRQIQGCDDTDLRKFAEEWIAEYGGGSD